MRAIDQVFSTKFPSNRFSYIGIDIDSDRLAQYTLGNQVGNIHVKLIHMDGTDIEGLKKLADQPFDLIIMNHPNVHDPHFAQTFINHGIPELLADNGSFFVVAFFQQEHDFILNPSYFDYSRFGYARNHGIVHTRFAELGFYDLGAIFANYKSPKFIAKNEITTDSGPVTAVVAAAASSSPSSLFGCLNTHSASVAARRDNSDASGLEKDDRRNFITPK